MPFTISVMTDLRPGPGNTDWTRYYGEFVQEATAIDQLGYRTIRVPESHGHDDGMMPAPFVALAGISGVTQRVKLMTYVVPVPLHRSREIVEPASVLDLMSGGRLELGLGAGGPSDQFQALGVDPKMRGTLTESRLIEIRAGLDSGLLPDGPDGSSLPVSPPPSGRVPIYYGGLSKAAIDRAVRLTDGCLPYDYIDPDANIPAFYNEQLLPALSTHNRSLESMFVGVGLVLWVSEDPDRDWDLILQPALEYRQAKYLEWAKGQEGGLQGMTSKALRQGVVLGTPDQVAERLRAMHAQAPFNDVAFWYRLPGVSHEDAMGNLERVMSELPPRLQS